MKTLVRVVADFRSLWRIWLPLLVLAVLLPLSVLAMPLVEKQLIDDVLLHHQMGLLGRTIALYAVLWLAVTGTGIARAALQTYLNERSTLYLRQRLLAQQSRLSLAFAHREHSGRTTALFHNDVPSVAGLGSSTFIVGLSSIIGMLVGIAIMFRLNWQLALVAGLAPPLVGALATVITRPLRPAARRVQEKAAELSERLQENLAGIREIAAFRREAAEGQRFETSLRELLRLRMRLVYIDTTFQVGGSIFSLAMAAVILGYGGYLVLQGQTTVGTLVAMRSLLGQTFSPAATLFGLVKGVQTALAAADRVYAFLDEEPRVLERPDAVALAAVAGNVVFEGVSFGYRPEHPVLHDISLTAHAGETIALVGPSGAGKSTLVSLIARFYDPDTGRVLMEGCDLRALTLDSVRSATGIVFQDTFLFATTIRENLAFANVQADEARLIAAARAANAWEFIERMPNGLDTPVGQRGVQLSEGQRQRLAIARALLRDPRILILDEPTSALDARSERLLQEALDNLMQGRTTFVIAHRLATVQRADRILVLEHGHIVEQGTHGELLRRGGLYRELHDLQFAPTAPDPIVALPQDSLLAIAG